LLNDEIRLKTKKTNLEKYGFINPSKSESIKQKKKETFKEKYNNEYFFKSTYYKNFSFEKYKEKYKDLNIISLDNSIVEIYCNDCNSMYAITTSQLYGRKKCNTILCTNCLPINSKTISGQELKIYNYISSIYNGKIIQSDNNIIGPQQLDIFLPNLNVAFEFNGTYWHCDIYKDNMYHYNKSKKCELLNINLYHIWENEWLENEIKIKQKINNLILKQNTNNICIDFDNNDYIYITDNINSKILFNRISINDWEIIFCDNNIKSLIKFFIKEYQPKSLIYIDNFDWSKKSVFNDLNFELIKHIKPDYKIVHFNKKEHKIHDCGKLIFKKDFTYLLFAKLNLNQLTCFFHYHLFLFDIVLHNIQT